MEKTMKDCIFCKIVRGEVPVEFVYQDEQIAVFPDIKPRAEVHLLLIPKKHVEELEELDDEVYLLIKNKALDIVKAKDFTKIGYRIVTNGGAAKKVAHLHFHLLCGVAVEREI